MKIRSVMFVILTAFLFALVSLSGWAQDTTTTKTISGAPTNTVQVDSAEVIYVHGNDLVVKMSNGAVRHITVPPNATATVDGKAITLKDVKPGMKLQKTVTTTTTPTTIQSIRTIKGKVWYVAPPKVVILTLPDGTNKKYNVPPGQKFTINGQPGQSVFKLKKGMEVEASVVKETPETVVASASNVTGNFPPPPPPAVAPVVETPPQESVMLVEVAEVVETPAAPAKLPKTGSELPLVGLLGALMVAGSAGLNLLRRLR